MHVKKSLVCTLHLSYPQARSTVLVGRCSRWLAQVRVLYSVLCILTGDSKIAKTIRTNCVPRIRVKQHKIKPIKSCGVSVPSLVQSRGFFSGWDLWVTGDTSTQYLHILYKLCIRPDYTLHRQAHTIRTDSTSLPAQYLHRTPIGGSRDNRH